MKNFEEVYAEFQKNAAQQQTGEFVEISGSEILEWSHQGQTITGAIIAVEEAKFGKKYTLQNEKGNFSFYGTAILDDRLSQCKIGDVVRIELVNPKHEFSSGNKGKMFRVWKKK